MRNPPTAAALFAATMAWSWLGGCANSKGTAGREPRQWEAPAANLVLPSPELLELEQAPVVSDEPFHAAWLHSRNDAALGSWPGAADAGGIAYFEIRQREYLRTINGRPREFSTTHIHSLRRGVVR